MITAEERRSEPRIEASASVVITPLAAVGTRFYGSVVNVSTGGVRVHCDTQLKELPRAGEVCRVQSRGDTMLCELRNAAVAAAGADLGFQIVHWGNAGELKRLISETGTSDTRPSGMRSVMAA
jgi:PilZ domain